MDRLNQLRGAAGSSSDSTLDTTSPPSEAFITANESSSKYFSLSEVDSTFDISPIKDVSLASASSDPERTITGTDELISNLSPISKKSDILDSYKIGKQIEAANILSGGVDIFDDNDNSYDGDELVIDDNVEIEEKSNPELKQNDPVEFKPEDNLTESTLMDSETEIASKDTEVVLQIDGKNVDAIDIGNGLYLYRKEGQEELAAVQIIDDDQQQPSFKFLKVRENAEGNLEVYEEIEIEVPKEVPAKEGKSVDKNTSHVPIKDINKVINDPSSNKVADRKNKTPKKEANPIQPNEEENEIKDVSESKSEVNLNGKMMKFSESRKSPVIGTFTPMTYHSTPNKEGIPLTKTMVNMQLQPSRHSDNVKKTIEVHTDSCKLKQNEISSKYKDFCEDAKETEVLAADEETFTTPLKETQTLEPDLFQSETKKADNIIKEKSEKNEAIITTLPETVDQKQLTSREKGEKNEVIITKLPETVDQKQLTGREKSEGNEAIKTILPEIVDKKQLTGREKSEENEVIITTLPETIDQKQLTDKMEKSKENEVIISTLSKTVDQKQLTDKMEKSKENEVMITTLPELVGQKQLTGNTEKSEENEVTIATSPEIVGQKQLTGNKEKSEENKVIIATLPETIDQNQLTSNISTDDNKLGNDSVSHSQENRSGALLKVDFDKNDIIHSSVIASEENIQINKSLDATQSTPDIDETSKQIKKLEVLESVNTQHDLRAKNPVEDKNESKDKETLICTPISKGTEENTTELKISEDLVATLETIKSVTDMENIQKDTLKIDERSEEAQEKLENKSSITAEAINFIHKNSSIKVLENKILPPDMVDQANKVSDYAQCSHREKKERFDNIDKKGTSDVAKTEGNPSEIDEESMEKSKDLDNKALENTTADLSEDKQPTATEIEHIEIVSEDVKNNEIVAEKQVDAKHIKTTCTEEKVFNKKTEKKTTEQNSGDHGILEARPITTVIDLKNKEIAELKQPILTKDVNPTIRDDDKIALHEILFDEAVSNVAPPVIVKDGPKTILKTVVLDQVPINNSEEIQKHPVIEPKLVVAKNSTETILKTDISKSSKVVKPAMTEIAQKNSDNLKEVKAEKVDTVKGISKIGTNIEPKPINNNNTAVPFGKWTEANRQEFLNKIKETKVPVNTSNSKPIKNSNDLNRRDVLKKIDSQRQSNNAASKAQEANKSTIKNETVFLNKSAITVQPPAVQNLNQISKIPVKADVNEVKSKPLVVKKADKQEISSKVSVVPITTTSIVTLVSKKDVMQRKEVNTQDLIDKTVEGMINKGFSQKLHASEAKVITAKDSNNQKSVDVQPNQPAVVQPTSLDAIEMKMNELHGIPFIERPPHELPRPHNPPCNNFNKVEKEKPQDNKVTKIPNLLPYSNNNPTKLVKDNVIEFDSEEEVIEHEPVTGDIEIVKKGLPSNLSRKEKLVEVDAVKLNADSSKKEAIITENEFDKFARRNSVTYENRITVSFDGKEPHNVIQTVVEKDVLKNYPKNDVATVETKLKSVHKSQSARQTTNPPKVLPATKKVPVNEDPSNKNYQSKLQIAYQSALTAKRHKESPITVIEDKPVKVVFMDANPEFIPSKLNVQGQNLSPAKKTELDLEIVNTNDSLDSEIRDTTDDGKLQDELRPKPKHQRKQVLTPVEAPELELIEPSDLGIEVSPKKKRKTEDFRTDKSTKNVIHKKSYLLGRSSIIEDKIIKPVEVPKNPVKETIHRNDDLSNKDTVTALDNLVKAAELLENQSESINTGNELNPDSQPTTPVKRGRGRPRKYPLPEGTVDKAKIPSPQKKPRLIDAKPNKRDTTTEEEESSDEEIVKENWTMGKINENIVCPICNKLFRSENVVFKHVKHCTGPSPNRSDTDKRSMRRGRQSQESDSKSEDMDIDEDIATDIKKYTPKKRISKDSSAKSDTDKEDNVIVIEDTPVKEKIPKEDDRKHHESRKLFKTKIQKSIVNNLVCEFCGKTFRQLSYLVSHKLQHKKEEGKKPVKDTQISKSIFSCDVCKKEFRKLHHLVQHRLIHNPQAVSSRLSRKSSSEQEDAKSEKEDTAKQTEDPSAGFRCEPCDKSFRKLHHLVEHRETHDGINRQKCVSTAQPVVEKPTPPPQCEICKKTFRKLHHLIEHKEQHLETSSEKSDDKSVKSSLSTKDIIHECPLCYMVFPNEHSLNKHTIICQRKKRQSKQPKPIKDGESDPMDTDDNGKSDGNKSEDNDEPEIIAEDVKVINLENDEEKEKPDILPDKKVEIIEIIDNVPLAEIKEKAIEPQETSKYEGGSKDAITKDVTAKTEITSENNTPIVMKVEEKETDHNHEVPKKKTLIKSKTVTSTNKRQKLNAPAPTATSKTSVETSDDDEVRYMLNPDFVVGETSEGKIFMKVRAKKRNSLQIERPNSKDLIKRRTSLQHPPKIPRLKPKPVEPKVNAPVVKTVAKTPKLETVPSTDSDDSDVKYSFPKTTPERTALRERPSREIERKLQRKSLTEKRKTLSCIAKRKSLGKTTAVRLKETTSPPKQIKRRTVEVEHRCDCGQLFSSAALLSRHTTLAHTPPRIRKRRSPPPDGHANPKPPPRKPTDKPKPSGNSRKSSVRSDTSTANAKSTVSTRKSNVKNDVKSSPDTRKSLKPVEKVETKKPTSTNLKGRRSVSTRTTSVPEKKRKSTQKSKI